MIDLYKDATSSAIAGDPVKQVQLLGEAIPALSTPVGQQEIAHLNQSRNYNMPQLFAPDGTPWPTYRNRVTGSGIANWFHSDIRDVAYLYVHGVFDTIANISNSNP